MQQALKALLGLSAKAEPVLWIEAEQSLLQHLSSSSPQEFTTALEHFSKCEKGSESCWSAFEDYAAQHVSKFNHVEFEKVYFSIGNQRKPKDTVETQFSIEELASRIEAMRDRSLEKNTEDSERPERPRNQKEKYVASFPRIKSKMNDSIRSKITQSQKEDMNEMQHLQRFTPVKRPGDSIFSEERRQMEETKRREVEESESREIQLALWKIRMIKEKFTSQIGLDSIQFRSSAFFGK